MNKSKILKAFGIGFFIGVIVFLGLKFIPRTDFYKNITAKKGGDITAIDLVNQYNDNEMLADSLYTNKQIMVTGKVASISTENESVVVNLNSADTLSFVAITLKPNQSSPTVGNEIKVKGTCAGKLSDVQITEGEIIE